MGNGSLHTLGKPPASPTMEEQQPRSEERRRVRGLGRCWVLCKQPARSRAVSESGEKQEA